MQLPRGEESLVADFLICPCFNIIADHFSTQYLRQKMAAGQALRQSMTL
ncbi:MAG: hypothetical protein ACKV0T_12795 [Planctomycetales bacterium]